MKALPTCTDRHKEERVKFATENLDNTFGGEDSDTLWIDVDEKNFKAFSENRVMYCPSELAHIFDTYNAATKVSKDMVMFFGAVARPRPSKGFDGKIIILPIVKDKIMKRSSKYAKANTVVQEPTTLDKKGFIKICTQDLLEKVRQIVPSMPEVKQVKIQMDRAGGHGGGRGDIRQQSRPGNLPNFPVFLGFCLNIELNRRRPARAPSFLGAKLIGTLGFPF